MPDFQRRALPVKAFQYDGRAVTGLPDWLRDYAVYNAIGGNQVVYEQLGVVYVPRANEPAMPLAPRAWAVMEFDVIRVYSADKFDDLFEQAPEA